MEEYNNREPNNERHDLAKGTFLSTWPDWLRWALIIPASILGVVILPILFKFLLILGGNITGRFNDGVSPGWWRIWTDIIQSLATGFVFVFVPTYIAPKKQIVIAVICLTISSMLSGVLLVLGLILRDTGGDKLYVLFHTLLLVIGAAYSVYVIKKEL